MVVIFRNKRNQSTIVIIAIGNRIAITDVRSNLSEILIKYLSHRFGVINDTILFMQNYVFFKIVPRSDKRFDSGPKMLIFFLASHHTFLRSIDTVISILPSCIYYIIFYNFQSFLDMGAYSLHSSTYSVGNSVFSIHCSYMAHYSVIPIYISMGHVHLNGWQRNQYT